MRPDSRTRGGGSRRAFVEGAGGPISVHFEYPPFERAAQGVSEAETRRLCAAAMRKDLAALNGYLAKYQIA